MLRRDAEFSRIGNLFDSWSFDSIPANTTASLIELPQETPAFAKMTHTLRRKIGLRIVPRFVRRWIQLVQVVLVRRWLIHRDQRPMVVRSGAAVVVAPHQDDETLGCGGLIALKRQINARVEIVFLTDGSVYDGRDLATPTLELIAMRRREALSALAALGVPPDHVHFFDGPDGTLNDLGKQRRARLVAELAALIQCTEPLEIYVPHLADRHPDHEAAFAITADALAVARSPAQIWQYPIWLTWRAALLVDLRPQEFQGARCLDIHRVRRVKRLAIEAYVSQLATFPAHFLDVFLWPYEIYFRPPGSAPREQDR